jgi:hypothetical protein
MDPLCDIYLPKNGRLAVVKMLLKMEGMNSTASVAAEDRFLPAAQRGDSTVDYPLGSPSILVDPLRGIGLQKTGI